MIGILDYLMGGKPHSTIKSAEAIIPDSVSGKLIVITGANSGLGKESALQLSKKGAHLILGCRSESKAKPLVQEIKKSFPSTKVEFIPLDLSDWSSIKKFTKKINERSDVIYCLLNNAGVMGFPKYNKCSQGMELQMSTNHFGHFLLTKELLPAIQRGAKTYGEARIVNLSSDAHKFALLRNTWFMNEVGFDFDRVNDPACYFGMWNYGQTKIANLYFTRELARLLRESGIDNIYVNAIHPGAVDTNLPLSTGLTSFLPFAKKLMTSVDIGALNQLYASVHPEIKDKNIHGQYIAPVCKITLPLKGAQCDKTAKKVWDWTEKILKEKGFDGKWAFAKSSVETKQN